MTAAKNNKLQGRRQEVREGREADEEGMRDELSLEVQPGNQGIIIDSKRNLLISVRNKCLEYVVLQRKE